MPFEKGRSGNPGGRPKRDTSLTGMLRKALNAKGADKVAAKKQVVDKLVELAKGGDVIALKYVFERIDGKCVQSVDIDISGSMSVETSGAAEKQERLLLKEGHDDRCNL